MLSICEIRKAVLDDAEGIGALITMLAEKFITAEFSPEAQKHFLASNDGQSVMKFMQAGLSYQVAIDGERIAGVIGVKDNAHLYHLFVDLRYQGRGLARRLWQVAKDDCIGNGNKGIFTVNSSNNAVGLYEKLGFLRTGPMQNHDGVFFNPMEFRD